MGRGIRAARRRLRGAEPALKVLDVTEFFSPRGGGVRTYLAAKARWCAGRDDVEHVLAVPGPSDGVSAWNGSRLHTIGGPPAPASPGYHVLTSSGRLRTIIRDEDPDVIEVGSIYLAPWLLRRALDGPAAPPVVGFFHMDLAGAVERTIVRRWPVPLRELAGSAVRRYLRAAYGVCRLVVGASDASVAAMSDAAIGPARLVPFGVDLAVFRPEARDPAWKTEIGADGRPVGLFVGRLTTEKNLRVVMDALPDLARTLDMKVVLIGDGGWRGELERRARATPDLLAVLPYEPEPARLARAFASADVYLAPSPHETFGFAALEAAASGLPIVGADAGALAARLRNAPWSRTFDHTSSADLVRAVTALLTQDRGALTSDARRAASAFSWDRTFEGLLEVYREAIEMESAR